MTCEVVLFTHSVGSSRLLSAVNELTTFFFEQETCQKFHSEFLDERASKTSLPVL